MSPRLPLQRAAMAFLLAVFSVSGVARTYPVTEDTTLIGEVEQASANYEDTLAAIGDRHSLGYLELVHANPEVDPWLPGQDTPIVLPTRYILPEGPRNGIVINLAEYRLYYFIDDKVMTYPVGVGTSAAPSPLTRTKVTMRLESPAWYPPDSVIREHKAHGDYLPRVVPPGPDNPLGPFALLLAEDGYLIHGTNKHFGIGMQVSHGCFRMYNRDISELVWEVPRGTPVRIVNEPVKLGVEDGMLWIEVHQGQEEDSETGQSRLWQSAMGALREVERRYPSLELNRSRFEQAVQDADGIPTPVGEVIATQVAREPGKKASEGS